MPKRLQLTLFLPESVSETIEQIRQTFNPLQYALIKSHVTLCRETELSSIEAIIQNLEKLAHVSIDIDFGAPVRFSDGKGVLIPAVGANESFQQLRKKVLHGMVETPGIQEPHITLIHPRNATCTDDIFDKITSLPFPAQITFNNISLIEQELGKKWNIIWTNIR